MKHAHEAKELPLTKKLTTEYDLDKLTAECFQVNYAPLSEICPGCGHQLQCLRIWKSLYQEQQQEFIRQYNANVVTPEYLASCKAASQLFRNKK